LGDDRRPPHPAEPQLLPSPRGEEVQPGERVRDDRGVTPYAVDVEQHVRYSAWSSAAANDESPPRNRFFNTLPAGLRGNGSSRISTYSGTLKLARCSRQKSRISS